MADQPKSPNLAAGPAPAGLAGLHEAAQKARKSGPPPVHLWNPPYCGEIGMKIARDGTWFYQGSPIGRMALVKLFASILRKDPDRYVLVTPVEMVGVEVEDAPFLAVELIEETERGAPALSFRTNVDDHVRVDAEHPLRFERGASEGVKPYVRVRGDLWALVTRAMTYDLFERGVVMTVDGEDVFGIQSAGSFFAIAPVADMESLDATGEKEQGR